MLEHSTNSNSNSEPFSTATNEKNTAYTHERKRIEHKEQFHGRKILKKIHSSGAGGFLRQQPFSSSRPSECKTACSWHIEDTDQC